MQYLFKKIQIKNVKFMKWTDLFSFLPLILQVIFHGAKTAVNNKHPLENNLGHTHRDGSSSSKVCFYLKNYVPFHPVPKKSTCQMTSGSLDDLYAAQLVASMIQALFVHLRLPVKTTWRLGSKRCHPNGDHRWLSLFFLLPMGFFSEPQAQEQQSKHITIR